LTVISCAIVVTSPLHDLYDVASISDLLLHVRLLGFVG